MVEYYSYYLSSKCYVSENREDIDTTRTERDSKARCESKIAIMGNDLDLLLLLIALAPPETDTPTLYENRKRKR